MKAIKCEMCNSGDFVKDGEFFVCQSCGTKYTVETIQKMRLEGTVDVTGSKVSVDNSEQVAKHLENARRAKKKEDWEEVEKYYNLVEESDPTNLEAIFYSAFGRAKMSLLSSDLFMRQQAFKVLKKCISILDENYAANRAGENKAAIVSIGKDLASMICGEFVYTYKKNLNGEVVEHNKSETYKLFYELVIAFGESIGNIEKKDDQDYMHDTAIQLYQVALLIPTVNVHSLTKLLVKEKEKTCSSETIEREAYKALSDGKSPRLTERQRDILIQLAMGLFDLYKKINPKSAIGCLGRAAASYLDGHLGTVRDELAAAAKCQIAESEKDLIKKYAQWENEAGRTLLFRAVLNEDADATRLLINAGADVNHRDHENQTALWVACNNPCDDTGVVEVLLDAGADPTVVDKDGVATYNLRNPAKIKALLKKKYPDLKQGKFSGCYIATCVYGSYDCPQVWTLRRYRDDMLAGTWYGRAFIRLYYLLSPTVVRIFGKTGWFQKKWRKRLDRMVKRLNDQGVENTPYRDKKW